MLVVKLAGGSLYISRVHFTMQVIHGSLSIVKTTGLNENPG